MTAEEPVGSFGRRLSRLMRERGLSQIGLARLMGLSRSEAVHRWVHGETEPTYIMLRRLREALGCTYDELFEG